MNFDWIAGIIDPFWLDRIARLIDTYWLFLAAALIIGVAIGWIAANTDAKTNE